MKAVRPHYKQSWPPVVHAISLWLTSTAFVSEEAATVGASESYSVALLLVHVGQSIQQWTK